MFISRSSSLRVVFLPLLFIFAFSIVCLSSQPSYAAQGYQTRVLTDYDGFLASNPLAANPSFWNIYIYGNKKNSSLNVRSYVEQIPFLCKNIDGTFNTSCTSTSIGGKEKAFAMARVQDNGHYAYGGYSHLTTSSTITVPDSWYGKKVVISFDLDISDYSDEDDDGVFEYTHQPTWLYLRWGNLNFALGGTCGTHDIPFTFMWGDSLATSDYLRVVVDFSSVDSSICSTIKPNIFAENEDSHATLLVGNPYGDYILYTYHPYIGYDILSDDELGSIEEITDDWRKQQQQQFDEEMEEIKDNANSAGTTANGILSVFQFTVLDPLASFWSLFSDGQCVNIPIVGGLINMEGEKRICSWWPADIRAITTPVFTTAGTLLLWGFVMKWLRDDATMAEFDPNSSHHSGQVYSNSGMRFRSKNNG